MHLDVVDEVGGVRVGLALELVDILVLPVHLLEGVPLLLVHLEFLDLLLGDEVHEEVEDVGVGDAVADVVALQSPPPVLLGVLPGPVGQFDDEQFAGLAEQHRGLGTDHPDVFVGLHNLLDACQRETVALEEAFRGVFFSGHYFLLELFELLLELLIHVVVADQEGFADDPLLALALQLLAVYVLDVLECLDEGIGIINLLTIHGVLYLYLYISFINSPRYLACWAAPSISSQYNPTPINNDSPLRL